MKLWPRAVNLYYEPTSILFCYFDIK